jgi:hypothetical protein
LSAPIQYLDFDLSLQRDGTRYRASVRSPAGEAQDIFELPFSTLQVENFLLRVGQPRRGVRRVDTPQIEATKTFGGELYRALFKSAILSSFRGSVDEADRQGRGLRLRLRLNGTPELADLPWEYLYDATLNRFIALGRQTPILRYLELPATISTLTVRLPLRVLVIVSSPKGVSELNSSDEWRRLKQALAPLEKQGKLVLERLQGATLGALQQRLREQDAHILHFIGHGGFDASAQDGILLFEDEDGLRNPVTGAYLGVLLRNHPPLRLVVANACDGARSSQSDPFAGVAQSLVQQGVPAVIAMQFEISDEAARIFSSNFYSAISNGYPVDAAVVEARAAIFVGGLGAEWGTPVLFMRAPDGRLFDVQAKFPDEVKRYPSLQASTLVFSALLILCAFIFSVKRGNVDHVFSLVGILFLLLSIAGGAAYFISGELFQKWIGPVGSKRLLLSAVLLGALGLSFCAFWPSRVLIGVRVRDSVGTPIREAQVDVFGREGMLASGSTNEGGVFQSTIAAVSDDRLDVEVKHSGYEAARVSTTQKDIRREGTEVVLVGATPPPQTPNESPRPEQQPSSFRSTFGFKPTPFNLSANPFNFGFSSLEADSVLRGFSAKVKRVRLGLTVKNHSQIVCCDAWILLGPAPFGYGPGGVQNGSNPFFINPTPDIAPTQVRFVIGNGGSPSPVNSEIKFSATYDFDSGRANGNVDNGGRPKEAFAPRMYLPNGLYAQIFLWNGNPNANVDIESISLTVEGEKFVGQN